MRPGPYLKQSYALPRLRLWRVEHPRVSLTMFTDDLGGGTCAKEEHLVVGHLASAAASLWHLVEEDLDSKVAEHKSALLASSDQLLMKLKRAFGKHAGAALQAAPNLGIDFSVGRRRASRPTTKVIRTRQHKFLKRCRRLRALQRAGMNMKEVFMTGLQSFSHHGAEAVGLDTAQLRAAHSQYLGMAGTTVKSSITNLALLASATLCGGRASPQRSHGPPSDGRRRTTATSGRSSTCRDSALWQAQSFSDCPQAGARSEDPWERSVAPW